MVRQNAELTFKGNLGVGRHDWLRLTPAYSVKLVQDTLAGVDTGSRVIDPFSGTGTTGLYAAEKGLAAKLIDVNPFLVWLAQAKTRNYAKEEINAAVEMRNEVLSLAPTYSKDRDLWQPSLFRIDRWWSPQNLAGLRGIRAALDSCQRWPSAGIDLLLVAFCRTLIAVSNAAFNHQSMSFKAESGTLPLWDADIASVFDRFAMDSGYVINTAQIGVTGKVHVDLGDSRTLEGVPDADYDVLYTSPPYVNRMSYIRELRPYMYWLRFIDGAGEAGELDWRAIGGTWGVATSRLMNWQPSIEVPHDPSFEEAISYIQSLQEKNGVLLAQYIRKYFHDMWQHFRAARRVLGSGGRAFYVVGNSTFFGVLIPTEKWYANLLQHAGFDKVRIDVVRKRNSKKALFEYLVTGFVN